MVQFTAKIFFLVLLQQVLSNHVNNTFKIGTVEALQKNARQRHPDVGKSTTKLIKGHGYTVELHKITTEDKYILDMHRIPHGKTNAGVQNKPVVYVLAGFMCSSADWVNMGPEKGLGYLLAEAGYDVWLGNYRGTTYGRKHVILDATKDEKEFFTYSYNEIGLYDLPASIDYILEKTKQKKLIYIGHSQATTSFFVMASEKPEYNEKVAAMVGLAPIAYMYTVESEIIRVLAAFANQLEIISNKLGFYEILRHTGLITLIGQVFCNDDAPLQNICAELFFVITGRDPEQFNKTMIPVILSNFPSGVSTRQIVHYAQGINRKTFRKFDYGLLENLAVYGQQNPPDYNMKNVTAPVGLFYAENDYLSSVEDVQRLIVNLPNVVKQHLIAHPEFNHLDYMWAIDAKKLLYDSVIEFINKYSNKMNQFTPKVGL